MIDGTTVLAVRRADESQMRRAERGVVAGYVHELSKRHAEPHAPKPNAQPSSSRTEGG
jgi:hypothetical protein